MKITDKEFLEAELGMGIDIKNLLFRELARQTVIQLEDINFKTVLDFGAGTGVYSDAFFQAGFDIKAYEIFESHRLYMKENVTHIEIIPIPITTDLLCFIETAEHMTDIELNKLFKLINPKYILFSSTSEKIPGWDEQWGHINIKEQIEWDKYFAKFNYTKIKDLSFPTNWSKLYENISINK